MRTLLTRNDSIPRTTGSVLTTNASSLRDPDRLLTGRRCVLPHAGRTLTRPAALLYVPGPALTAVVSALPAVVRPVTGSDRPLHGDGCLLPDAGGGVPPAGSPLPVAGSALPVNRGVLPAGDSLLTAGGSLLTADGSALPAGSNALPVDGSALPLPDRTQAPPFAPGTEPPYSTEARTASASLVAEPANTNVSVELRRAPTDTRCREAAVTPMPPVRGTDDPTAGRASPSSPCGASCEPRGRAEYSPEPTAGMELLVKPIQSQSPKLRSSLPEDLTDDPS